MSLPSPTPSGTNLSRTLVVLLVGIFVVASIAFVVRALGAGQPTGSPGATDTAGRSATPGTSGGGPTASPNRTPGPGGTPVPTEPGGTPTAEPSPTPTEPLPTVEMDMPIVPVVGFWDPTPRISRADLVDALEGRGRYATVLVPTADREAIARALGITIASGVVSADPDAIRRAMGDGSALGLLRAADVTPLVHALAIGNNDLFGNDRLRDIADWPVTVRIQDTADRSWDQATTWTLTAGGDMITDRGTYERTVNRGKGIDYPFDGGTIEVTGRYCCGYYTGYGAFDVPTYHKTGNRGIVRDLLQRSDLAIANMEQSTPDEWIFHLEGTPFSGNPKHLQMFTNAGIDFVSLANNHIADYRESGIRDTLRYLPRYDLKFAGAGRAIEEASRYEVLEVKGTLLAILPCVNVVASQWAREDRAGAMPCTDERMMESIASARREADFVIVFPHWGTEYTTEPRNKDRRLAERWIDAGVDLVLGAHSHVAGAIEEIDGKLVFYSMGNFVFDQNWAEITMEGLVVHATFHGGRLVQTELLPTLIHDQTQPNLLDPQGSGQIVLDRMRRASRGLLDY